MVEEAERVRGEARIALGKVRFQLESVANQAQAEVLQTQQIAQARVDAVQSEAQAAVGQLQAQSSAMQSEAHAVVNQLQSQNVALQSQNEHLTEQNKALSLQLQSQALKIKEQESFSNQLHQQLVALQGLAHAAEPPPTPVPKASHPAEQAASASSQNGAELVDALKALAGEVGGTMRRIEQTLEVALSPNASPKRKAKAKAKAKTRQSPKLRFLLCSCRSVLLLLRCRLQMMLSGIGACRGVALVRPRFPRDHQARGVRAAVPCPHLHRQRQFLLHP